MSHAWQLPPDAAQRYLSGESLKDLADEYGTSYQTLGRRLRAAGIETRGRAKTAQHRARLSAAKSIRLDEVLLREMSLRGLSCREMSDVLEVSEECVRERMIRLGIDRLPAKARPDHNHFWRGGRTQDKSGYVLIHMPDHPNATAAGYVREHRFVMEEILGRYLKPEEVVDHRDGDTSNNDPVNLRLFASNADHLQETLRGRTPNWTEDGQRRIQAGVQKAAQMRRASRTGSETDGPQ